MGARMMGGYGWSNVKEAHPTRLKTLEGVPSEVRAHYEPDGTGFVLRGLKPRGDMSEREKVAFIEEHGLGTFLGLVSESRR